MKILLVILLVLTVLVILYAFATARRLDKLNRLVVKSRQALERALTARAQYAHEFSAVGGLDIAGAILLAEAADMCLRAGMRPIVADNFDSFAEFDHPDVALESHPGSADDRRTLESNLSRTLRLTVDEMSGDEIPEESRQLASQLDRARLDVRMTRSFHNSHVAQVHQVRRAPLVSLFRLYGRAAVPSTVDMDDECAQS